MVVYILLSKQNEAEKTMFNSTYPPPPPKTNKQKKPKNKQTQKQNDLLASVGNEIFISQPSKRCI